MRRPVLESIEPRWAATTGGFLIVRIALAFVPAVLFLFLWPNADAGGRKNTSIHVAGENNERSTLERHPTVPAKLPRREPLIFRNVATGGNEENCAGDSNRSPFAVDRDRIVLFTPPPLSSDTEVSFCHADATDPYVVPDGKILVVTDYQLSLQTVNGPGSSAVLALIDGHGFPLLEFIGPVDGDERLNVIGHGVEIMFFPGETLCLRTSTPGATIVPDGTLHGYLVDRKEAMTSTP